MEAQLLEVYCCLCVEKKVYKRFKFFINKIDLLLINFIKKEGILTNLNCTRKHIEH